MTSRALVLGGGGPVGIGWEAGMLKGLDDQGIHLGEADLIVGTSAGSAVGTQIASGVTPAALFDEQLALVESGAKMQLTPDLQVLIAIGEKWDGGLHVSQDVRAAIGALGTNAKTGDEQEWIETFRTSLPSPGWPERRLLITGVDVTSGEFVVWDSTSGVKLELAIAASCSVPGILPPVSIDGHRYMDGGVRSVSNADLAKGYGRVVVIAPSGSADNPFDHNTRLQLEEETQTLRDGGSTVAVVLPDAAALVASGPNRMDTAFVRPAAEAGLRQAKNVGDQIRAVWQG